MKKLVRILVHIFFPVLFISLGALSFWFYQNYFANKPGKLDTSLELQLRQQIEDLQKQLQASKESTPSIKIEKTASGLEKILPVITYEAEGLFNQTEKDKLKTYVINPFFDYYNEKELEFVAMVISKKAQESLEYSIFAINKNSGYHSFLIKRNTWWSPDCMEECPYAPAFKAKYPEIVKLTNPNEDN